ncbi:MAG: hypothetical protein VX373_07315, partial [Pseudomonadota bacterium]|nr:hypothetical protein [Pseudomonadota bacterium]
MPKKEELKNILIKNYQKGRQNQALRGPPRAAMFGAPRTAKCWQRFVCGFVKNEYFLSKGLSLIVIDGQVVTLRETLT